MLLIHLTVFATIMHFLLLASISSYAPDVPPISLAIFLFPWPLPTTYCWHSLKFHILNFIYQFKLPSICRKHLKINISSLVLFPELHNIHTYPLLDNFTSQIQYVQNQIKFSPNYVFPELYPNKWHHCFLSWSTQKGVILDSSSFFIFYI